MDFIKNDLICKEYEERKRFIKDIFKDLNFSNNLDNEKNIENEHHLNKLKMKPNNYLYQRHNYIKVIMI